MQVAETVGAIILDQFALGGAVEEKLLRTP
jgi:hypothetical protein